MKVVWILLLLRSSIALGTIEHCGKIIEKSSLCHTDDNGYDMSGPNKPYPSKLTPSIEIHDIVEFNPEEKSVTFLLEIFLQWNDTRLELKSVDPNDTTQWYFISEELSRLIYMPTLRYDMAKRVEKPRDYGSVGKHYFWFEKPHRLEFREVVLLTVYCIFDFEPFPFDQHTCNVSFGSMTRSYNIIQLKRTTISHRDKHGFEPEELMVPNTSRLPFRMKVQTLKPFLKLEFGYNYSYTGFTIHLERIPDGRLKGGFVIPTTILAGLSIISFLIDPEKVPGRIGFLLTISLIITSLYMAIEAPNDRGFSKVEAWMCGVQFAVMFALVEYGVILALHKYYRMIIEANKMNTGKVVKMIDTFSMFFSLISFVSFYIVFWHF